jgi:hypothetical protein
MPSQDAVLLTEVAAEMFAHHGRAAIGTALEREESERTKARHGEADRWLDIASAVARLVSEAEAAQAGNDGDSPAVCTP